MPSEKLNKPAHKHLIIQVEKYRQVQNKSPRKIEESNDSSDDGFSDHEENQDQNQDKNVSSGKNDNRNLAFSSKVTIDDIKNLVLASYRSLSRQITNLSDQIENASSRLSTLESLVTNMTNIEEKFQRTRGSKSKNDKDAEVITLKSTDSSSECISDSDSDYEFRGKEKKSTKAFDTSVRLKFPLETENDFYIFNAKIAQQSYRRRVLKDLWQLVNKRRVMSKNIEIMIRHYMTKNVATCYSTKNSTDKKKAFIDTLFYQCIAEVLRSAKAKPVSDEQIHDSIAAVLKSCRFWNDRLPKKKK